MKAVVYSGHDEVEVREISDPKIERHTDAIIKVNLCAISGGDVHIKSTGLLEKGKIIGNEYCGVVVETGKQVSSFQAGDRVIGRPYFSCGRCYWCNHQQPQLCIGGSLLGFDKSDGVQAEFARIPYADNTLKKIPDDISDEDALLLCNVISAGYTGLVRANVGVGDAVAVFGAGPVGLSAVMCAHFFGPSLVMVVDIVDFRLDFARKLGAIAINAASIDTIAAIRGLTDGRGADICIDAAGVEDTFKSCLQSTRKGGRVDIPGLFSPPPLSDVASRGKDVFTLSMGLPDTNYTDNLVSMIKAGKLKPRSLITHRLSLEEAKYGYELVKNKLDNSIKVIFKC